MKALLLIGAIVGALAVAGTAAADSGNRASVTSYAWCTPTPLGTTCVDVKTVTKLTLTGSGNVGYLTNGTETYTSSFASTGCTQSVSDAFHVHWLNTDQFQTEKWKLAETATFTCGTFAQTCVLTVDVHLVNGETQFEHADFSCAEL
ncbi:MAG: hypothetical protein ACJ74P_10890 [Gaiellaceae bacterium]|jgi:hypothetical protein